MKNLLFVNACMRAERSRTLELCQEFLKQYTAADPQCTVIHRDLTCASCSHRGDGRAAGCPHRRRQGPSHAAARL